MLTPPDSTAQARFDAGKVVGCLACEFFSGGRGVTFDPLDFADMAKTTKEWLEEGVETIYEATFIYDGVIVMVDILRQVLEGLEIYEVKSSTDVEEIYLHDASIQQYVLEQLGYSVAKTHIVHIDKTYVRDDVLDLDGLFKIVDVTTETTAMQADIPQNLSAFKAYLADQDNEPPIDIGKHCNNPYECDAKNYCWKVQRNIPDYSIFNIFNLGSKKQVELYQQGIIEIAAIPNDFSMTALQQQKVDNWKSRAVYIDKEQIRGFVDGLSYPLYHLDFETFQQVVPQWKGVSPYQQIPFQYSLHIEYEDGTLEHKEFLGEEGKDPRYELAHQLVEDIPADVTVLAYNMGFEKGVISKLAASFPELADHLLAINVNMQDLMVPFQKQYYVTPAMQGSYSIKYVLPALVPEMEEAYKNLDGIHNGGEAMNAYASLHLVENEIEVQKIRNALLEYCKLDTLAMVEVLKKLKYEVQ